ncbi:MAG: hypothetical protein KBD90_06280 [Alphaproteobacteria bacterium]|nr:hypothetical protein [Alphaproteobacteria bacterium]
MKQCLILASRASGPALVCDLPYLLKQEEGFQVTVISPPYWQLTHNSFIDIWIEAGREDQMVIAQAADLIRSSSTPFDLIIFGSDELLWTVLDSDLEPSMKEQFYPINDLSSLSVLEGKIGVSLFCEKMGILHPPFFIARTKEDLLQGGSLLGLPVMVKIPRSGGGGGVKQCHTLEELHDVSFNRYPLLMQKYIEGETISVEPFYDHSHLKGYNYSKMTLTNSLFGPSVERIFQPYPDLEPLLKQLGSVLGVNGFLNMSFIQETTSGLHYLIEMDFRPNRWVAYGNFVGVDWLKALSSGEERSPSSPKTTRLLRHFPEHFFYSIRSSNLKGVLYWVFNCDYSWKCLPLHDKKLLFKGIRRFLKKSSFSLLRRMYLID